MSDQTMLYRPLGASGLKLSALGLGGWTTYGGSVTDQETITRLLRRAFEAGINFFDSADIYARGACDEVMGKALRDLPRHRLVISSKVFWPMSDDVNDRGLSRKHIMESVHRTLERMGTDYLDIYFCHRFDPETPVEETLRAMDDLIHQGKVLYWGTSEWTGDQLRDVSNLAERRNLYRPQVEQPQYNLLERRKFEQDVLPTASKHGMGLVTWSPLASGLLSGKYDAGLPEGSRLQRIDWLREQLATEENLERVRRFEQLAREAGATRAQLAIAWAAARPGVTSVITGATRDEQLEENLGALSVKLSDELMERIDALFPPA